MTKNSLLNIAVILCKITRLIIVFFFLSITIGFISVQINKSSNLNSEYSFRNFTYRMQYLNDFKVNDKSTTGINISYSTKYTTLANGEKLKDSEIFVVEKLTNGSLYFNFIKIALEILIIFLCVTEFQKVIESVKKIKTFQKRNVSSFRKIGIYLLIYFILNSYYLYTFQEGGISGVDISITFLILPLLAYILSEYLRKVIDSRNKTN